MGEGREEGERGGGGEEEVPPKSHSSCAEAHLQLRQLSKISKQNKCSIVVDFLFTDTSLGISSDCISRSFIPYI